MTLEASLAVEISLIDSLIHSPSRAIRHVSHHHSTSGSCLKRDARRGEALTGTRWKARLSCSTVGGTTKCFLEAATTATTTRSVMPPQTLPWGQVACTIRRGTIGEELKSKPFYFAATEPIRSALATTR